MPAWTGPFGEWTEGNRDLVAEAAALELGQTMEFGGGVAPLVTLARLAD